MRGCLATIGFVFAAFVGIVLFASGFTWVRLHLQAGAVLDRWTAAVEAAGGQPSFAVVGERTRQLGDWELTFDNGKPALMAGAFVTPLNLPADTPPDGTVRWPDGSTEPVRLASALSAFNEMRSVDYSRCQCEPLRVTAARLTTRATETTRGLVDIPVWEFTVEGTAVRVTHPALAGASAVSVPSAPDPGSWVISIDQATIGADDRHLVVRFGGGPGPGEGGCLYEYATEAVESRSAVVVLLHEHPCWWGNLPPPRAAVAYGRTADVRLASPLNGRAVLEPRFGQPVRLIAPDYSMGPVDADRALTIAREYVTSSHPSTTVLNVRAGTPARGATRDGRASWVIEMAYDMVVPPPAAQVLTSRELYYVDIETAEVRVVQVFFGERTPAPSGTETGQH